MRFFFDAEFWESPGRPIELISLAVVSETGAELYVVSDDFDWTRDVFRNCSNGRWLENNVAPHLAVGPAILCGYDGIGEMLRKFVEREAAGEKAQFYGYYCAYDWVVLCQLFGSMVRLPKSFPKFAWDLKALSVQLGDADLPKKPEIVHSALYDARWIKEAWISLMQSAETVMEVEVLASDGRS